MARPCPFAAILLGLPRPDGRAGNFAYHRRQDDIAFQFHITLLKGFPGHHESGDSTFHVRNAQALHLSIFDGALEFRLGFDGGDHAKILGGSRETRVHMTVEPQTETRAVPLEDAYGVRPFDFHVLADRLETVGFKPVEYELSYSLLLPRGAWNAGEIAAELRQLVTVDLRQNLLGCVFIECHW